METFDFTREEAAPDLEFSEVILDCRKRRTGADAGARRAFFIGTKEEKRK